MPKKQRQPPPEIPPPLELGRALNFMRELWRLNHAIELISGHMERSIGITAQQRMIIRCLGKHPGLAPSQLAELLHLDRSTISSALNRMKRNNLIIRRCDTQDRRSVSLWLSNKGKKLDQPSEHTLEHGVEGMLAHTEKKDRVAASRVMNRLTSELDSILKRAGATTRVSSLQKKAKRADT
jgi:MarR family transcriptional regulator, organic hydroperoxide resistance regulator